MEEKPTLASQTEEKTRTKREKYIKKLTKQLKEWDRELEDLEQKSSKRLTELQKNLDRQLENLKTKRNELRGKMNRLEGVSGQAFKDIKADTQKLWDSLKKGFKTIRKELKK